MNESVRVNTPIFHSVTELNNGLGVFEGIKKIQWGRGLDSLHFLHRSVEVFIPSQPAESSALRFSLFVCVFSPCIGASVIAFSFPLTWAVHFVLHISLSSGRNGGSWDRRRPAHFSLWFPVYLSPLFFKLSIQLPRRNVFSFYLLLLNIIIRKMRSVRAMVFQKPGLPYFFYPLFLHFFIFVSMLLTKKSTSSKWVEFLEGIYWSFTCICDLFKILWNESWAIYNVKYVWRDWIYFYYNKDAKLFY